MTQWCYSNSKFLDVQKTLKYIFKIMYGLKMFFKIKKKISFFNTENPEFCLQNSFFPKNYRLNPNYWYFSKEILPNSTYVLHVTSGSYSLQLSILTDTRALFNYQTPVYHIFRYLLGPFPDKFNLYVFFSISGLFPERKTYLTLKLTNF